MSTADLAYILNEHRGMTMYDLPVLRGAKKSNSRMNQRKLRKLGRQNPHSKYAK
jgi:hypothetical protein